MLKASPKKISQEVRVVSKKEFGKMHFTEKNILAALSYLWLLVLIPFLFARKNEYVQFHARQGIVLLILELIFGWFPLFTALFIVVSCVGVMKALQGDRWKIPVVSTILEKLVSEK